MITTAPGAGPLSAVDRAAFVAALTARLRAAGVAVPLRGAADLTRLLAAGALRSPGPYWAARITLVCRQDDLAAFDQVCASVFGLAAAPSPPGVNGSPTPRPAHAAAPRHLPDGSAPPQPVPWITLPIRHIRPDPAIEEAPPDPATGTAAGVQLLWPSARPVGAEDPFDTLSAAHRARLAHWLDECARDWPRRRSRRPTPAQRPGEVSLRATMAAARRTGWEPIRLGYRVRRPAPRRVVVLIDVSESMRRYSASYLELARAFVRHGPAEAFAFATTATRLTVPLRRGSSGEALAAASARVGDRFAGTRIAASLGAVSAAPVGAALRGAVVLIASDGWDSEEPPRLGAAMARLARRARQIIWLNPRAGAADYLPRVASMAAALPYCDRLLPADTFGALAEVITTVCVGRSLEPATRMISSTTSRARTA